MTSKVRCSFVVASLRELGQFDVPGHGFKLLGYRERLLLEYHNGLWAGHQGQERRAEMLERDLWWPRLYKDVWSWCGMCQVCRSMCGRSDMSAWTRTEFYSRPFQALRFDTVT